MRVPFVTAIMTAAALSVAACGSTGYSAPSSPSPSTTPSPASSSQVTVDIVGSAGSAAFSPNPVSVTGGAAIVFKNDDSMVHHIVLDNGADFGTLSPGQTSVAMTISSSGALGFHCTNHPSMVGTINAAAATAGPAPGPGTSY